MYLSFFRISLTVTFFSCLNYRTLTVLIHNSSCLPVPNHFCLWMIRAMFPACGGQVTRPSIIETPNFMGAYTEGANCTWNITAPAGHVILLRWAHLQLLPQYRIFVGHNPQHLPSSRVTCALGLHCLFQKRDQSSLYFPWLISFWNIFRNHKKEAYHLSASLVSPSPQLMAFIFNNMAAYASPVIFVLCGI
jgi:hypothetical protein